MGNSGYGDSMALLINDLSETLLYLASGTAAGLVHGTEQRMTEPCVTISSVQNRVGSARQLLHVRYGGPGPPKGAVQGCHYPCIGGCWSAFMRSWNVRLVSYRGGLRTQS